jgi:hypothetical protein
LIEKKCYEVLHKSDKPWPNCPLAKALKDKRPHTEEVCDPNIGIPLLIIASPLFDENGELTTVVHVATDITKRKKAREVLRAAELRYRTLFESIPMGIRLAGGFIPPGRIFITSPATNGFVSITKPVAISTSMTGSHDVPLNFKVMTGARDHEGRYHEILVLMIMPPF